MSVSLPRLISIFIEYEQERTPRQYLLPCPEKSQKAFSDFCTNQPQIALEWLI
ncbi:hypothetical protein STRDD11_00393 [Streptococcus sp. DD11]|nr:hypothetical protein STRDD11_00393 [Streptococcus sp. DD11]